MAEPDTNFEPSGLTDWARDLSWTDRQRLRAVVRRVHMARLPAALYSDKQADMLIEAMGPAIAEKFLKQAVDKAVVS